MNSKKNSTEMKTIAYDPFCWNPLHSGANLIYYSELKVLEEHVSSKCLFIV